MSCFQRTRRATDERRMSVSLHAGLKAQELQVLGHVRADEVAVLLLLEADVFQAQFEPGDFAGVHVAQQPGIGVAAVVALSS